MRKVTAIIPVAPGNEEAFTATLPALVAGSRDEPGVHRYDVWREAEGERRYVVDELYADDTAVAAHAASAHFKAFFAAIGPLLSGAPTVIVSAPVDVA